jgi:copper chaperone CopZ
MTCAFAVRGALQRLSGVENVEVSLNNGLATIKLKPGNVLAVEQLWETVQRNGFTPKETRVIVRGDVLQAGGKLQLKVSGGNRIYDLAGDAKEPNAIDELKWHIGKPITLEGALVPVKDLKLPVPIQVRGVRP